MHVLIYASTDVDYENGLFTHNFPCSFILDSDGKVSFAPEGAEALMIQTDSTTSKRIPLTEAPGCGQQ
jgi:hypothetical protein